MEWTTTLLWNLKWEKDRNEALEKWVRRRIKREDGIGNEEISKRIIEGKTLFETLKRRKDWRKRNVNRTWKNLDWRRMKRRNSLKIVDDVKSGGGGHKRTNEFGPGQRGWFFGFGKLILSNFRIHPQYRNYHKDSIDDYRMRAHNSMN